MPKILFVCSIRLFLCHRGQQPNPPGDNSF
jgi:hypothetical protein